MTSDLPGFTKHRIRVNSIDLAVHVAGDGPPLVLLHGYPQTHLCWLRIVEAFTLQFRVIVPDLRGYGDSDRPADDAAHSVYSKREMARDIVALLDALGHSRVAVLGHDRGARVAYRMALDTPERVTRLGIIEILPTAEYWRAWGAELGFANGADRDMVKWQVTS